MGGGESLLLVAQCRLSDLLALDSIIKFVMKISVYKRVAKQAQGGVWHLVKFRLLS